MHWLQIIRLSVLGFAIFCGIIVASLSAHLTAYVEENFGGYDNFAVLGIATGGITIISLPVMLIVDLLRKGAFTSLVVVELSWLSILWVLWIATAALTVDETSAIFSSCDFFYPILNQLCHETQAVEAFSFLAWIALMAYTVLLLIVALVNTSRGSPMWKSSVRAYGGIAPVPKASTVDTAVNANAYPTQQYQPQPIYNPGQSQPGAYRQPATSPASGVSHTQNGSNSGYSSYPQV
ncbi:hypothetical protein L226DRAFT_533178 [Lentinus tigrinus ALCF2SS1-7]|uniref:uncharacterized protein n=1 Tax=Lentinus tigrinus ALCF2SS1-7 TaxID=1328758 RepID=UPI0011662DC8|nr:hypothetical protein L226DRAFT_533178 [Lentinus tigrinus ALCF2SS1-7]